VQKQHARTSKPPPHPTPPPLLLIHPRLVFWGRGRGRAAPQGGRKGHKAGVKRPRATGQGPPEGGCNGPKGRAQEARLVAGRDGVGANGFRKKMLTALGPWPVAKS
jgi:hypothetical protein